MLQQLTNKNDKTEDLLETRCSQFENCIDFLMNEEMNWNNIELDYIQTLSSFNLSDINQLKQAAHYANIQPLLSEDNRSKSDRVH